MDIKKNRKCTRLYQEKKKRKHVTKKKPIPKIEAQHEKDHQTDMLKKYSNTNNNYSVWSARGSNQQATILEANTLSITPGK